MPCRESANPLSFVIVVPRPGSPEWTLAESLLKTLTIEGDVEWVDYGMVINIDREARPRGSFGYVFTADGEAFAARFEFMKLEPAMVSYLKTRYSEGNYPVRLLIGFNRATHRIEIESEFTDMRRWQIDPDDFIGSIKAIRPHRPNWPDEN